MATYSPGRPPTEKDMWLQTNGSPIYLGSLVSTGTAVNNATTATPFLFTPQGPFNPATPGSSATPANFAGTLAGRLLLLQASASGLMQTATNASMVSGQATPFLVAQQTVMPPAAGTAPGNIVASGSPVLVLMLPNEGWLQWLPVSGSANLHVWEMR